MKKTKFLISSLLAAGFTREGTAVAQEAWGATDGDDAQPRNAVFQRFALDHAFTLAGHRSHSSHSSHSSHRSGSGGYPVYTPSYPVYIPPSPPPPPPPQYDVTPAPAPRYRPQTLLNQPAPDASEPSAPRPLSGRTELFTSIVKRVQLGLLAYGYYNGKIDGAVGTGTREAILRMQTDFKLNVTGNRDA